MCKHEAQKWLRGARGPKPTRCDTKKHLSASSILADFAKSNSEIGSGEHLVIRKENIVVSRLAPTEIIGSRDCSGGDMGCANEKTRAAKTAEAEISCLLESLDKRCAA